MPADANATGTNQPGRRGFGPGFGGGFGRYNGPRASRDELLQRMRDYIHTVVGRYKGKVKLWDVVNEALADGNETNVLRNSLWLEIIGPDFIAKAFQYAHEADPQAILRYNDYYLENPAKRKRLIYLIKDLQAQKVPVHAIGSQAHVNVSTSFETRDRGCWRFRLRILGVRDSFGIEPARMAEKTSASNWRIGVLALAILPHSYGAPM